MNRYEHKVLHYAVGDGPDGTLEKDDWALVYQRQSDDGLFTVWERQRKPMGSVIREAVEAT